ncbi:MAG: response regulator [Dehalococcoidia bacterium]
MFAEDNPGVAFMLNTILEQDGRFEVLYAADGEQALSLCYYYLPHIAILDLMMPKLHGLKVCKALKATPKTRHIKVVMLTGIGGAHSVNEASEAGVDVYMTKPFVPEELIRRVETLLWQDSAPAITGT